MGSHYRPLSSDEIAILVGQGCSSTDWSLIQVVQSFSPQWVWNVQFSGKISLGLFEKTFTFFGGVTKHSGIRNALLHNCTIGNNVYIDSIKNYIANYLIEDDVIIENTDLLAVEGPTSFGNGIEISVLIESGGREVIIFDYLSSHVAYILSFYRHRPRVIAKLRTMINAYVASVTASIGVVARSAHISNSHIIKNVRIGPACVIEGVDRLENGSINSCIEDPVLIKTSVKAYNFIISSGSRITDGVIIANCFVGQGCVLSKHYSIDNSIFFANCGGSHGEAWSIFAGPYTVTFHKSTLLISGFFSFLNAGSGSNQSNHMYKLGPIHQGILERGSKTASDSYILWPAKVGPFTVVHGRHYRNSDTSNLPFSYLIENNDESILVPGANLRSVGTIRDAIKWPQRDRRKDPRKLDYISFNLLSPFTIQKMVLGYDLLKRLKETSGETSDYYTYSNVRIKKSSLNHGMESYQLAIIKFLGNALIKRLEKKEFSSIEEIRQRLIPQIESGSGKWIDLAGLFAPEEMIESLLDGIERGSIGTMEQVDVMLHSIYDNYYNYGWSWAIATIEKRLHKSIQQIDIDDIITLVKQWKESVIKLDMMLLDDARKEYSLSKQTGFGIDGDLSIRQYDFEQVRGLFEENDFVVVINKHMKVKSQLCDELIQRLNSVKGA
ncbi:MAG: DUF4954 family protein [Chitinivibrionales bacterium]|nr:DUF4954 family protein [Chitinivibrionales bacterium]